MTDAPAATSPQTPANTPAPSTSTTPAATTTPAERRGIISDGQYDNLPLDKRDSYARVRRGPDSGSEWVARDQLGTEPATNAPATGERHKFGEMEFTEQELRDFLTSKADA